MALSKKNRLAAKKEIDKVFKNGRTVKGSSLFIRFLNGQKEYPRLVFIVPTKHVSLAVDRNKIKRIFSEIISRTPILQTCGYDVVVIVHKKVEREEINKLGKEMEELLNEFLISNY